MRPDRVVRDAMYRALAVLRVAVLLNALALGWYRRDNLVHPSAGVVVFAVITAWTAATVWAYSDERRRRWPLLVADLAVAVAAIGVSPWVKGEAMRATLPGFWVMGAVLAWAIAWGWRGGLVAGVAVSLTDVLARVTVTQANYGNLFLLLLGGPVVGFLVELLQRMARERDAAERLAAAADERARLARVVHDGVLQVLALVQRRAPELGPEGAELGRLAGEQETALRTLVQTPGAVGGDGTVDLRELMVPLESRPSPRTTVSTPGEPVLVSQQVGEELVAAVRACLHNVSEHVGPHAPAWVLVEDLGAQVVVSVRDDGPGVPAGRLEEAAEQGRLGVAESIRGRLAAVGGTAELHSGPGTEWELAVPKGAARG